MDGRLTISLTYQGKETEIQHRIDPALLDSLLTGNKRAELSAAKDQAALYLLLDQLQCNNEDRRLLAKLVEASVRCLLDQERGPE